MIAEIHADEFQKEFEKLDGWKIKENRLYKCFVFKSHIDAVKFVEAVSLEAIGDDRYPEIKLSFEKVELYLPDEDSRLSQKDFDLASKIDKFSGLYEGK